MMTRVMEQWEEMLSALLVKKAKKATKAKSVYLASQRDSVGLRGEWVVVEVAEVGWSSLSW